MVEFPFFPFQAIDAPTRQREGTVQFATPLLRRGDGVVERFPLLLELAYQGPQPHVVVFRVGRVQGTLSLLGHLFRHGMVGCVVVLKDACFGKRCIAVTAVGCVTRGRVAVALEPDEDRGKSRPDLVAQPFKRNQGFRWLRYTSLKDVKQCLGKRGQFGAGQHLAGFVTVVGRDERVALPTGRRRVADIPHGGKIGSMVDQAA